MKTLKNVIELLSDDLIKNIAIELSEQDACLRCVPFTFCGSFESKKVCIECYYSQLKINK